MKALIGIFSAQLAEAILCFPRNRNERVMGINERLDGTGRTALGIDPVEFLVYRNSVSDRLLSRPVIPLADNFNHLKFFARFVQNLMKSIMPVPIHRISGWSAYLQ